MERSLRFIALGRYGTSTELQRSANAPAVSAAAAAKKTPSSATWAKIEANQACIKTSAILCGRRDSTCPHDTLRSGLLLSLPKARSRPWAGNTLLVIGRAGGIACVDLPKISRPRGCHNSVGYAAATRAVYSLRAS